MNATSAFDTSPAVLVIGAWHVWLGSGAPANLLRHHDHLVWGLRPADGVTLDAKSLPTRVHTSLLLVGKI